MAEFNICCICRRIIVIPTEAIFVKAKGQPMRSYCMECVKGGCKDAGSGKGN